MRSFMYLYNEEFLAGFIYVEIIKNDGKWYM